jgi:hypothetical protein
MLSNTKADGTKIFAVGRVEVDGAEPACSSNKVSRQESTDPPEEPLSLFEPDVA